LSFRPLTLADLPTLHEWLSRPHVAEWWDKPSSRQEIAEDYAPIITDPQSRDHAYIVLADGAPIGFIQSYVAMGSPDGWWPDERDPGVRGIDQFLAHPEQLGQGLGTEMVKAFAEKLFEDPEVTRIQTDPSPDNRRAIRCYEKAGFRALREVDTPDGPALLMICER
jgi:RimJ/RimL family protein N-acetyltransferase